MTSILSQALFCRNREANRLQRTVGLTMFASRVPCKILNVLSKLGTCQSYRSICRQVAKLSEDAQEQLRDIVRERETAIGLLYDNINYMDKVKHQSAVHHSTFTSAVVGNIILLDAQVGLPSTSCPQVAEPIFHQVMSSTMPQPSVRPRTLCTSPDVLKRSLQPRNMAEKDTLCLQDALPNQMLDSCMKNAMVSHIINGFIDANPKLEHLRPSVPQPAVVFPLVAKKSTLYPLPIQRCDEAKIDGNIDYFRRVLRYLDIPDADLEDMILPTFGDVFSVDRIRLAVQQCRWESSSKHFDKFKFPEPFMGPFHLLVSPRSGIGG